MRTMSQAPTQHREKGKHQSVSLKRSAASEFPRQKTLLDCLTERECTARKQQEQLCPFMTLARSLASWEQQVKAPMLEWCAILADRLHRVRQEVENHFTIFEAYGPPCPSQYYPILQQLRLLHRTLIEVFVLIENVSGQCKYGHLSRDPTNSYGQLREYIGVVQQNCQTLGRLLQKSMTAPGLPLPGSRFSFLPLSGTPEQA